MKKIESYKNDLDLIKLTSENSGTRDRILKLEQSIKSDELINEIKQDVLEEFKVIKTKWETMIDVMMIVGKYFESNCDFINVMKLSKR